MAESDSSSGGASQLPKSEAPNITFHPKPKIPRRKLTLIAITVLLNVLLWSSVICLSLSIYQFASNPSDTDSVASEVLTLVSALVSIAYFVLHTIFSSKQRTWRHQSRDHAAGKDSLYIAIRCAGTLCVVWLLTTGWNMIIVARRPVCLPSRPGIQTWETGAICQADRANIAFAVMALVSSFILLGMLAVVRRPFEARLLTHGYGQQFHDINATPIISRQPSPSQSALLDLEKAQTGRESDSTHRDMLSNRSDVDVQTLDLRPPSIIYSPSPVRSGIETFKSNDQAPSPYNASIAPSRASSRNSSPPVFHPSTYHPLAASRMSAINSESGFIPLSVQVQYSASVWRAVHPTMPPPWAGGASRSHSHLPQTPSVTSLSYVSRYSRSSVSLTRPYRLSSINPDGAGWGSRNGSVGPEDGRGSPSSGSVHVNDRATANEIAHAILNGTPIPGTNTASGRKGHARHASAPDSSSGAQQPGRKEKGRGPQPNDQIDIKAELDWPITEVDANKIPNSTGHELEMARAFVHLADSKKQEQPFRRSRSESLLRSSNVPAEFKYANRTGTASQMPQEVRILKSESRDPRKRMRRRTLDEARNKPLPKIAAL
ncbi:hypothetical protein BS50DRAFT_22922 [Corynespora cassiicola Philippines]|uniref:Uncharacterized protein n=1 Tax=Corynespora cassiicola Philippines TaxID=1448308 RepID=A0A2T2PAP3_CORCC|nr:hypothetical protein BS50DRAFT_22922 [Corynespora cassiicola Philippines]